MRMRKKPNLGPRMERCAALWIREPASYPGRWRSLMPQARALRVEVGCGKGKFTVEAAAAEPDTLFIAVERVQEAMVVAMERTMERKLTNVFFVDMDAARMDECFAPGEIDRLYLNFSDPWPRKKNAKRRLTHRSFLEKYKKVIRPDGEIWFKTDNSGLFDFSLEEFQAAGLPLSQVTRNLHEAGPADIMTDYEEKFYKEGVPICRCVARIPVIALQHSF